MTDKDIEQLNEQHIVEFTKWIKEQDIIIYSVSAEAIDTEGKSRAKLESELEFETPEAQERFDTIVEIDRLKRKLGRIENDMRNKKLSPPKNVPETAPLVSDTVSKAPEGFMSGWKFIVSPKRVYCWKCKLEFTGKQVYEYHNGLGGYSHMCVSCKAAAKRKGEEPPVPK